MPTSLIMPRIACGGYTLREWDHADTDVVREAAEDPYIPMITTVPAVFDPSAAAGYIERQKDRARTCAGYSLVVIENASSRPIGNIGLWLRDIDLGRASIGYWLVRSARGKGCAAKILTGISEWAFSELEIPRLELYIEPWNTASVRSAERARLTREGLLRSWQEVGGERVEMYMLSKIGAEDVR
ncbi:GNAT family N-acetyltransferase [Rhodococcus erythropolis]|uniref:GNAT family N-acetyltransferase n=1 Tax=Rhodococcus erythropolis TaxID=1833 RepID=UPI002949C9B3|nr:GNAT family N-acetyltransferase [Rhodococcus erythropolis]MDV6278443.1 GNAT family N-acetyltransferase [Rhodococcus erythropolis]